MLAACGGSNGDDPGAGARPDDAKRQAFIECLRKAGVHVEESANGRERTLRVAGGGGAPTRLQRIQRTCARKTGGGPREPTKAEKAKFLDQALKFARCMRAHGIDIPDPQPDGGGIRIGGPSSSGSGGETFNPKAPAFQRAQKACESFMPGGKGGAKFSVNSAGKGSGGDTGPSNEAVLR